MEAMNITVPWGANYVGLDIYDDEGRKIELQLSFFENSCGWGVVLSTGDKANACTVKNDGHPTENKLKYEEGKFILVHTWRFIDSEEYFVHVDIMKM